MFSTIFNKKSTLYILKSAIFSLLITHSSDSKQINTNEIPYTIGIIQIVDHPALDITRRGIVDVLNTRTDIKTVYQNAQGNLATAAVISQNMIGQPVNIVVAIGTSVAKTSLSAARGTNIPIVFASITDPKGSELIQNLKVPEGQITGSCNMTPLLPQIQLFQEIVPNLKRLGMIYNPGESNAVMMVNDVLKLATHLDIQIVLATAVSSGQVAAAAQSLIGQIDAIFISNDNTALSAFESLVQVTTAAQVPLFVSDVDMVEKGALAALGPNQYQVGVDAGHTILKLLDGAPVSQCPVTYPQKIELYLNQTQASKINIRIPQRIINQAVQKF